MNVLSWLKIAQSKISGLDSELILSFLLSKDRSFLHAHPDLILPKSLQNKANKFLSRRENNEPLAYIFGYKEFYGRNFKVTKNTLIPRPATEDIIDLIKSQRKNFSSQPKILDLGTGSGCIAITLALEIPSSKITAADICQKALKVAKFNADNLHSQNITFIKSDLLSSKELAGARFDIICANLPYVDKDWHWNSKELSHEPAKALYASNGGLSLIYKLIDDIKNHSTKKTYVFIESDQIQHEKIIEYATSHGLEHTLSKNLILVFRVLP